MLDKVNVGTVLDGIPFKPHKPSVAIARTFRSHALSLFHRPLPVSLRFTVKPGTFGFDGFHWKPRLKVSTKLYLLSFAARNHIQSGNVWLKASIKSSGRWDYGLYIDRRLQLFGTKHTSLYANISHKAGRRSRGNWKTACSFGLYHCFRTLGAVVTAKYGVTPQGHFTYEFRCKKDISLPHASVRQHHNISGPMTPNPQDQLSQGQSSIEHIGPDVHEYIVRRSPLYKT